ncbi:23S rRNA (adenine(2030)-N(6))-methyltransferase RlmJ [Halomonas sp. McH1-25]|uniref:23S rRNA (adenine(2030)-N(6))-methyltransferase RlmJ n=1 Tax=unclassified Halomonas TaxID=2609666 RepID=UPI001EF5FA2B|nr:MULTISPECIES: 23S rRNA (adenine(2030)-N(6))-methyltransferase RlmJ [unclassified Halomonas]MCG7599628.1 23S rRNA (adenine(2030)-N(6))-methyltransferase RlmJ [Halomonas sp. McH1-25]MCP1342548.1 23S rRNA (adenine(2030)-N(6))-methyltransferase RlmJ [Halomonas sp. FL8]MCP1361400.1 23S rRNA (adenine(2030)-N(6))-methyltransferase RlmJ [Halomonas sp. BBD45]MCP1366896.1 23S rRNA (adenine(2030)-N(6))-methyltransferase RlmJ [Halomonas sp. BBD48]
MLAYQHAYHAGNFADVHKHLTLYATQRNLLRKESSVTYVDTHAGRGRYPLAGKETQKLKEYQQGILPLWEARRALGDKHDLLEAWFAGLDRAQESRSGHALTHYPGSPWWLTDSLRKQDRLSLFELHPGEHDHLEAQPWPVNVRRIHADGLAGLRRLLPVSTPRLCVLIDPSYERKEDYAEVADTLAYVARKARHAQVAIWYPLLPAGRHQTLLEHARDAGLRKLWRSEVRLHPPGESHGMYGSGMLLFNPPWGLDETLNRVFSDVVGLWGREATHRGDWWVEE